MSADLPKHLPRTAATSTWHSHSDNTTIAQRTRNNLATVKQQSRRLADQCRRGVVVLSLSHLSERHPTSAFAYLEYSYGPSELWLNSGLRTTSACCAYGEHFAVVFFAALPMPSEPAKYVAAIRSVTRRRLSFATPSPLSVLKLREMRPKRGLGWCVWAKQGSRHVRFAQVALRRRGETEREECIF